MSTDILWRLEGEGSPRALYGAPPLLIEAADEIKRLRAREARLREALEKIAKACDGYQPPAHLAAKIARAALEEEKK